MKISCCTNQEGYIALLSTIIIGAVLLTMTIGAGQSGWYTRFMVLGTEAKQQSKTLASGCINHALARVMADTVWHGDATTTSNAGTCYVFPVQKNFPEINHVTIRVRAVVRGAMTNLVSEFNMNDINVNTTPQSVPISPPLISPNIAPSINSIVEVGVMP